MQNIFCRLHLDNYFRLEVFQIKTITEKIRPLLILLILTIILILENPVRTLFLSRAHLHTKKHKNQEVKNCQYRKILVQPQKSLQDLIMIIIALQSPYQELN